MVELPLQQMNLHHPIITHILPSWRVYLRHFPHSPQLECRDRVLACLSTPLGVLADPHLVGCHNRLSDSLEGVHHPQALDLLSSHGNKFAPSHLDLL